MRRWLEAYAASGGHGDKSSKTATQPYRDILERLWIVDPVPAWLPSRNRLIHLVRSPKHHLTDPALAARILGLDEQALLTGKGPSLSIPRDGSLLGHLF
ncbi:DUF4143 domain-containing protein [Prosthecochloris ethylica]|uniref:DUF4143 domain-containing protein n=1 Tax=Prosthecochloris ethylica TaxID=2743976 RepID=UPI001F5BCAD4|nr:DUF4143 domain-containing protein [Prosthecochloris ethylica]